MRSELIEVGEETQRADELVVPDVRFIGLFVSKADQKVLEFAYRSAIRVHVLILARERSREAVKRHFEIDLPDLGFIVETLRKHEREEIVKFQVVFQALVKHLLPEAQPEAYTYDGHTAAGVKYKGMTWVSG